MGFCAKCGAPLEDGAVFCGACGAKVEVETPVAATPVPPVQPQQPQQVPPIQPQQVPPVQPQQVPPQQWAPQQPQQPKKPVNGKLIGGIVAAAVVAFAAIIALVVFLSAPKTINLEDYVVVEETGYDTVGQINYHIDKDRLTLDMAKAYGLKADDLDDLEDLLDVQKNLKKYMNIESAISSIAISADKTTDLSNGDTIVFSIVYDNKLAKKCKVKFKGEEYKYTVEKLTAVQSIDPFEGLEIRFEGTEPEGYARLEYNGNQEFLDSYSFELSKSNGISVGDEITVSITYNNYYLDEYGVIFSQTEKKFTCDLLDKYCGDFSEVPSDKLDKIKNDCTDAIEAYFADYNEKYKTSEYKYEGVYFLKSKEDNSWTRNIMYVVYSTEVSTANKESYDFKKTKVYLPMRVENLLMKADGEFEYSVAYHPDGYSYLGDTYYSVNGYTKAEDMYNDLVVAQKTNYTSTVNDGLKSYK